MGTTGSSVQNDWLAHLPAERRRVFDQLAREWEASYAMLSVALDEAIGERDRGRLVQARRQTLIAGQLATRLLECLLPPLHALRHRARARGVLPVVEALRPGHFRSERAQGLAAWSFLVHGIPMGRRLRFLAKLAALRSVLERTAAEFCEVAQEVGDGGSVDPGTSWRTLDVLHYDLNTVMRESVVVLKSYLSVACDPGFAAFCRQLPRPGAPIAAPAVSRVST